MKAFKKTAIVVVAGALAASALTAAVAKAGASTKKKTSSATPVVQVSSNSSKREAKTLRAAQRGEPTSGTVTVRTLHRPGERINNATDTGSWSTMYEFMKYVVEDNAAVWGWYYGQWKLGKISTVRYSFPLRGQSVQTGCGDTTNDVTMEYCPADDTLYFSQALATAMWNGTYVGPDGQRSSTAGGDYAVAMMLSHEYGHNVQAELGISPARYGTAKHEQHADCLSGAFTRIAYYQGILNARDVDEGLRIAFMVGDSYFQRADHHGTPQERVYAFRLGYNSSGPAGCDAILNG